MNAQRLWDMLSEHLACLGIFLTAVVSCFHNCKLKTNWRRDTLMGSHEMRDGQILKKNLYTRHLIKATFS
jgi:hypothetical protein